MSKINMIIDNYINYGNIIKESIKKRADHKNLIGKTINSVKIYNGLIAIETTDNEVYILQTISLYPNGKSVEIVNITGNVADLIGSVVQSASVINKIGVGDDVLTMHNITNKKTKVSFYIMSKTDDVNMKSDGIFVIEPSNLSKLFRDINNQKYHKDNQKYNNNFG